MDILGWMIIFFAVVGVPALGLWVISENRCTE